MGDNSDDQDEFDSLSVIAILKRSKSCTLPFMRFLKEYSDLVNLFMAFVLMAAKLDDHKGIARKIFDRIRQSLNPDEEYRYSEAQESLHRYGDQFSRNMVVGMANNFFSYVSEVLQTVLANRPEILRSSEKLTTEEVLQFSEVKDIVSYIADRKVNELSYGGLRGVETYLKERLGLDLFDSDHERVLLTILTELRNIYTHNRGVVNRLFLKRVGQTPIQGYEFVLGEAYEMDFLKFDALARNAINVAYRLDERLVSKFNTPTQKLNFDE